MRPPVAGPVVAFVAGLAIWLAGALLLGPGPFSGPGSLGLVYRLGLVLIPVGIVLVLIGRFGRQARASVAGWVALGFALGSVLLLVGLLGFFGTP